jgi:two-component system OmpR family response regulator
LRLLIVDDDAPSAAYLARGLTECGHVVDVQADGADGLAMALEGIYDALVVDRRLPGLDGIELVRRLRDARVRTPVLMLSALSSTADRVEGLRAGSDDYLVKPYAFVEVLARLEALLRRADRRFQTDVLEVGDLRLDTQSRKVTRGEKAIALQPREYAILQYLMRHSGQVVTRTMLIEAVWDYAFEPRGNIVDMHVHRLRRKIEQGSDARLLHTIAGAGYLLGVALPGA